ncbi:hypothetical protein GUJ93_ZPchr0009g604 [Zizania palustris]|uniref:General transcription factor 3C polypeptide 1 winged-helix domain-containing protein n=1 Tax=Zizania palustris TaxID=103762 RepID=A0A8J5UZ32_ZIZPA|nr:hypothetical protein GUJ93_ZPchr0009g604 [Zizania palustris]
MDELVSAALEEVCARLSPGLPVTDLWLVLRGALEVSDLPLGPVVKHAPSARLIALLVIRHAMGEGNGAPIEPAEKDVEEAERRGVRLVASATLRDNFLRMYHCRFTKSEVSDVQKATLECVGARCLIYKLFRGAKLTRAEDLRNASVPKVSLHDQAVKQDQALLSLEAQFLI